MANHLTKLRADSSHAESVIREIFNGLPVTVQRGYLEFLSSSIEFLSTAYSDRWGTSLFKGKVRLNVGWVEALTLRTDGLYVLVEKESAPTGTRFLGARYKYAPGCDLTRVPLGRLSEGLSALSEA